MAPLQGADVSWLGFRWSQLRFDPSYSLATFQVAVHAIQVS
jgi:hypothetical protein